MKRPSLNHVQQWACYYGENLPESFLKKTQLVITDPDSVRPTKLRETKRRFSHPQYIGYISIGEVENYRWYWSLVKNEVGILSLKLKTVGTTFED